MALSPLHHTDRTEENTYQQVTTMGFRRTTPCQSVECSSIWMTEPATGSITRQGSLSRWTSQEALPLISKSHGTCILQKLALQGLTTEGIEEVWVVWVGMERNCPALYVRTSEREVVVQSEARRVAILPELVATIRWSV